MTTQQPTTEQSSLPVLGMVFGLLSLTGVFAILSIPAIVISSIALKKTPENRGYSITGLISGIISTVLSFIFVALFIIIVIVAAASEGTSSYHAPSTDTPTDSCRSWDRYCSPSDQTDDSEDDPTKLPQST